MTTSFLFLTLSYVLLIALLGVFGVVFATLFRQGVRHENVYARRLGAPIALLATLFCMGGIAYVTYAYVINVALA